MRSHGFLCFYLEYPAGFLTCTYYISACEYLLDVKSAPLKLKDNSEAVVNFKARMPLEDPSAVAAALKQHETSMQKTQEACVVVKAQYSVFKQYYNAHN